MDMDSQAVEEAHGVGGGVVAAFTSTSRVVISGLLRRYASSAATATHLRCRPAVSVGLTSGHLLHHLLAQCLSGFSG
jgi:hypothetical protein